jgi:hypothetical protein
LGVADAITTETRHAGVLQAKRIGIHFRTYRNSIHKTQHKKVRDPAIGAVKPSIRRLLKIDKLIAPVKWFLPLIHFAHIVLLSYQYKVFVVKQESLFR